MEDLERAERIKALREDRGLTQPAVADEVGVTLRAYQAWEATGGIREGNAKKLAAHYGVPYQWLWSGRDAGTPDLAAALNGDGSQPDPQRELRDQLDRIETTLAGIVSVLDAMGEASESSRELFDSKLERLLRGEGRAGRRAA